MTDLAEMIEALYHHIPAVAVPASEAARMLSVKREVVYQLHHDGILNGFRVRKGRELRFLVEEIREVARQMSANRENA